MQKFVLKQTIGPDHPKRYCDAMAQLSGLPKSRIKRAMSRGAAWIKRPGKKMRRIRRATAAVHPGDAVALYYDEDILAVTPPEARCLKDLDSYSIWLKPAGLMSQGTRHGDHCALLRQVDLAFNSKRSVFPVHRLDREAAGLIIIAHHPRAAAALSDLFRNGKIDKRYHAWVRGDLSRHDTDGEISLALDNRPALTHYKLIRYEPRKNQSLVEIQLMSGRLHQIRRHFNLIGHPVMGDPRYGTDNKNKAGLQLTACALTFTCPFGNGSIDMTINPVKMQ